MVVTDSIHTARCWVGGGGVGQNAMKANGTPQLPSHIEGLDPRMRGSAPPELKNGQTCKYFEGKSAAQITAEIIYQDYVQE